MAQYNHIALVRRDEVIELFKNGSLFPQSTIQFAGSLTALAKKPKDILKIFAKTPVIEYSINYFILYLQTDNKSLRKGMKYSNLISIIPLDEDSERMGLSLSPEVKLERPIFQQAYLMYLQESAINNAIKGVENIGTIFGYDDLLKSIKKVTKKTIGTWVTLILDEGGKTYPKTIWEYLLSYVRSQTYPNGTAGAFLDTMSIVHNFTKGMDEMKDQKSTTTGRLILEVPNQTYSQLIEYLAQSSNFVKAADKGYKGFWKIAPMYFILLDKLSTASEDGAYIGNMPLNEFIASVKIHYEEDILKPALFLVGITLGQSSTYKLLYNSCRENLPFLV